MWNRIKNVSWRIQMSICHCWERKKRRVRAECTVHDTGVSSAAPLRQSLKRLCYEAGVRNILVHASTKLLRNSAQGGRLYCESTVL